MCISVVSLQMLKELVLQVEDSKREDEKNVTTASSLSQVSSRTLRTALSYSMYLL